MFTSKCSVCNLTLPDIKVCEECKYTMCGECAYLNDEKCSECNTYFPLPPTLLSSSPLEEEEVIVPPYRTSLLNIEGEEEVIIPPPVSSFIGLQSSKEEQTLDVFMDSKIRLPNIGNSCYINSALQICLHSKRLWKEWCEIIGEQYVVQFLQVVTILRKKYVEANKIQVWEQCDSVSVIRFIFDKINDLYPKGFNPLYGLCLHSQYKCMDCKYVTHQRQFESIYCLFPNETSKCVSQMIEDDFCKTEVEYKCSKCESKKSTRSVSIDSLSEYIFLSIQHIGDNTNFTIDTTLTVNNADYYLVGCVEHLGRSENGGHYVSYFKDSQNNWSIFDDDKISPISYEQFEQVRTQNKRQHCQITLAWYSLL